MTVGEIIYNYLRDHGYDGLYNEDISCDCSISELFPCIGIVQDCIPGYENPCTCGEHAVHICPNKYTETEAG